MDKTTNTIKQTLAIVCPQVGAPSETFVRNHLEFLLPGNTVVITSGVVDNSWLKCPFIVVPKTYGDDSYPLETEAQVVEFIKEHGVTHILCEFGSVGTGVVKLNHRLLHLPLFVHFFGQDSSEELRKSEMVAYYKWMGIHVSGVITVAKTMTERLASIGVPVEKLHTNSCGVDIPDYFNQSVAKQPCRFLSVTRLVAKKGVFHLIEAFSKARTKLAGITLDIIGDGPQRLEIENFIIDNNLSDAVFLHGTKSHAFVKEQLNRFSVYAQHSITDPNTGNVEGLPVIILEAAAHGLPVISTYHEGIPEAVEHGITGLLVNEGDTDKMAEYMIQLAQDTVLRHEIGLAGRKKIEKEFAIDVSLSILRRILGVSLSEMAALASSPEPSEKMKRSSSRIATTGKKIDRVLFVNHSVFPYETSGTPISTLNHALEMASRGINTAVLIPAQDVQSGFQTDEVSGIKIHKVPRFDKYLAYLNVIEPATLKAYLDTIDDILSEFKPEIIHINDYVYMPVGIMEHFHNSGALVVRNICNDEELCHFDYPVIPNGLNGELCSGPESAEKCADCAMRNKFKQIDPIKEQHIAKALQDKKSYLQHVYKECVDGVIFTESAFKQHFTHFMPIDENKTFVIPRGIQASHETIADKTISNRNRISFGFVGNIMFSKGIDVVLKAFGMLCHQYDFTLHVFGQLVDKDYALEINKLQGLYPEKLVFHGPYKKEDILKIAESIDICIVTSHFDTYNRVVREMLLCGLPLIVTDFFGASIIRDGVNGFKVPVGDFERLAQQMRNIINKPDILPALFQGARETRIPTIRDEVDNILNSYNKLLEGRIPKIAANAVNQLSARLIAFYLPQFHTIPENDLWWGKGFTEWTNVAKALPSFTGHYQPHVPSELGYYDLGGPEVMNRQAALAKEHGISGFCFYHYWFNGRLLLEKPLHAMLHSGQPDFPFCLCWANEDWTRSWDGKSGEILMQQKYGKDDDIRHFHYLANFFEDKRYIRIDGKPLFLIYRASRLPEPAATTDLWRDLARRAGLGELYLCKVESFLSEHTDPAAMGFDASVEFQPDWSRLGPKLSDESFGSSAVYRYDDVVKNMVQKQPVPYRRFSCVTPSWDNSPRRNHGATTLIDSSPEKYGKWLSKAILKERTSAPDNPLVFINAWNEWGEGNHLEPDLRFGRRYLQETLRAVRDSGNNNVDSKGCATGGKVVSIIVPVFDNLQLTRQCINALQVSISTEFDYEVIVVDNASTDGTPEYLDSIDGIVTSIRNRTNLGFAAACNQGARSAQGEYLVFLNNDTIPQEGWLTELVDFIRSHPAAGIVGSKLLYPDDTVQHCGASMCHDGAFFRHQYKFLDRRHPIVNRVRELDAVTAACFITPRDLFFQLGGFDEQYLNGCEDMDYCTAVRNAGYRIFYTPESELYHLESQTPRANNRDRDNFARYLSKWGAGRMKNEIQVYAEDGFWEKRDDCFSPVIHAERLVTRILDSVAPDKRGTVASRIYPAASWKPLKHVMSCSKQVVQRILFVCHDFPPYKLAGAQLFALRMAQELAAMGHDVRVFHPVNLSARGEGESRIPYRITKTSYEGLPVYRITVDDQDTSIYGHPQYCFEQPQVEEAFRKLVVEENFDIVHFHLLYRLSARLPIIARELGIPTVATLHDYWLLCAMGHLLDSKGRECTGPESPEKCASCLRGFEQPPTADVVKFFEERLLATRAGYEAIDMKISPSSFLADCHAQYGFTRPEVLPLGWIQLNPATHAPCTQKVVFGYLGQIIGRKGLDLLLSAVAQTTYENWELRIYGEVYQAEYFSPLYEYIKSNPRINYCGPYKSIDLDRLYAEIDVAVVPSRRENYPLTVIEALSAKVPVIATDVGGVREIMLDGVDGIIVPAQDPEALRAAIERFVADVGMVQRMRSTIRPVKTIRANACEYERIYRLLSVYRHKKVGG